MCKSEQDREGEGKKSRKREEKEGAEARRKLDKGIWKPKAILQREKALFWRLERCSLELVSYLFREQR